MVKALLLSQRNPASGAWNGKLSSSALSTALAVIALRNGEPADKLLAKRGVQWLVDHINNDGGWGDTPRSTSNITTSLIARACVACHPQCMGSSGALAASGAWILAETGGLDVGTVAHTLAKIYGADKTFAVPILMYLAICSNQDEQWHDVPPIPFYLALLPRWCFRFLKLEVVSYALPALIAVGLCQHIRVVEATGRRVAARRLAGPLLRKLRSIQPEHGGFLDAAPLSAFVAMALDNCGYGDSPVALSARSFLRNTVRSDGSWPIDTNLRCWLTSLSARALSSELQMQPTNLYQTREYILKAQHRSVHPYTGARPGGWAWTDLPGGVPDADDSAAALIALFALKEKFDFAKPHSCAHNKMTYRRSESIKMEVAGGDSYTKNSSSAESIATFLEALRSGFKWLLNLQNSDGGIPTFCRGWGHLPFDRSCCDITAHVIEAITLWRGYEYDHGFDLFDEKLRQRLNGALLRMIDYLRKQQRDDGSWLPLWFGHQCSAQKINPVIGTARVVAGLHTLCSSSLPLKPGTNNQPYAMLQRGENFLINTQKSDGGWSAGQSATIEETALAVAALSGSASDVVRSAAYAGAERLAVMLTDSPVRPSALGLYFSALWYDEELYPLIWSVAALRSVRA